MKNIFDKFWGWYEKHYAINVGLSTALFLLQLVHLYWLSTNVVATRLTGRSLFHPSNFWEILIILVDYTEIPALIGTSLIYIHGLRKGFNWKDIFFLVLLNSQWLHLFWITDEVVIEHFVNKTIATIPTWLAWTAICIDYLELPVMVDTIKKFLVSTKEKLTESHLVE